MSNLHVAKFGGTSMGSATALRNASLILARDPDSRLVVVSACSGVTNQLIALAEAELRGDSAEASRLAALLVARHGTLAGELGVVVDLAPLFAELDEVRAILRDARASGQTRAPRWLDQIQSLGERLSSELFAAHLRKEGRAAVVFDARRVLRTDSVFGRAEPDPLKIAVLARELLGPVLEANDVVVTQGFIGSNAEGVTTTLGRGGSDYSASLFGEALRAAQILIWTDVPGVFTMDPSVVSSARPIPEISFAEASELANFGAKVLHPSTLLPASRANVPVFVGSTFQAGSHGTWIRPEAERAPLARAVALRRKQTLITVTSQRMLNAHGFLANVFETLAEHKLSVDVVSTSEVSVALTVDGTSLAAGEPTPARNEALLNRLRDVAEIKVEEDLTLVALIGNKLTTTPGVGARALKAAEPDNVRLLCHGASAQNLCFLVSNGSADAVAQRLHAEFLEGGHA